MDDIPLSRAVSKPCLFCRKRKVKCDRGNPCRGCIRFNRTCIYEEADDRFGVATTSGNNVELQARLTKVEALLEQQRSKETAVQLAGGHQKSGISDAIFKALELNGAKDGVLLEKDNSTVFVDQGFWVNFFQEADKLELLVAEANSLAGNGLIGALPDMEQSPEAFSPSPDQARVLIDLFFERVEPFINVVYVYESAFRKDCEKFWAGNLEHSTQFGALICCIFALTARVLPSDTITVIFGASKASLLERVSGSARNALAIANVSATRDLRVFQALLYWITFLYQNADIESANGTLGLAKQVAYRQGLQKDPFTLGLSELTAETRARAWNHLCYLETKPYMFEGINQGDFLERGFFPKSMDDSAWEGRLHSQAEGAAAARNLCLKFAVLRRQFATLTCQLLQQSPQLDGTTADSIVKAADDQLQKDYFPAFEENHFPTLRRFEALCVRIWYQRLQLSVKVPHLQSRYDGEHDVNNEVLTNALSLLSVLERAESAAESFGWSWVFRCDPEFVAVSILLHNIINRMEHMGQLQIDEAWRQVAKFYQRHDNEDYSLRNVAVWRVLEHFRKQALERITISATGLAAELL